MNVFIIVESTDDEEETQMSDVDDEIAIVGWSRGQKRPHSTVTAPATFTSSGQWANTATTSGSNHAVSPIGRAAVHVPMPSSVGTATNGNIPLAASATAVTNAFPLVTASAATSLGANNIKRLRRSK